MAGRRKTENDGGTILTNETDLDPADEDVVLISLTQAKLTYTGPSGEEYVFPCAGSEVKVKKEDSKFLLGLKSGGCCGASLSPYFQLKA